MTAFRPEPHTLLIVVAPTELGTPALIAACRAGFCPIPADTTFPISTSSTSAGATPAFWSAALMHTAPKAGAGTLASAPPSEPIGVRTPETIKDWFAIARSTYWWPLETRALAPQRFL